MPWTVDDHRASAQEALDRKVISGKLSDMANVPEPQQSSEHQARVSALSVLNRAAGSDAVIAVAWSPWAYQDTVEPPPVEPPVEPPPPPPPSDGWGDGKTFGNRTTQSSQIVISGQNNVVIDNLFFEEGKFIWQNGRSHNAHVPIRVINSQNVIIKNCDFRNVSQVVSVEGNSSDITVEYTRTDGIVGPGSRVDEQTGNFLQTVSSSIRRVVVSNNKILVTTGLDPWGGTQETMTEDVISFFAASDCTAEFNQIDATGYVRDYGTGIIAGDATGDGHTVRSNTLLNPGQVGLATAGGYGHRFFDNLIWKDADQNPGSGNTAAYFWDYNGAGIGDGLYQNNRAKWHGGGGFWNPGGAQQINNNWNDSTLDRDLLVFTL